MPVVGIILNNLGIYYFKQGDYFNFIKKHLESVVIEEKLGNELVIISSNIVVYDQFKDYDKDAFISKKPCCSRKE
ncbi:MAG: hypothetical protein RMJ97_01880 [Raineya sp.]|nr:hypothetical protein [Raineya sp.]